MKKMKFNLSFFTICLSVIFLYGCFRSSDGKSNEDRRRECEEECAKITFLDSLNFNFESTRYSDEDIDTITVKEISPSKKDTAVYTVVGQRKVKVASWTLRKQIPLKNEYLIIVPGEAPHVLKNFKMAPSANCNMVDCGYVPELHQWELDGKIDSSYEITIEKQND